MKIFAKRKRRVLDGESTEKTNERNDYKSDPIVEELLTKEPSTWNAKQRRMVKRYQDRQKEEQQIEGNRVDPANNAGGDVISKDGKESYTERGDEHPEHNDDVPAEKHDSDDDGSTSDGSDSDSEEETNELDEDVTKKELKKVVVDGETNDSALKTDSALMDEGSQEGQGAQSKAVDDELQQLLDKLNSKQRRKLMRQLERGGNADEVRKEALGVLQEMSTSEEQEPVKKKRRKKGAVDWKTLPPEERKRREDQRRLQVEAAERRAAGDIDSKHSHPLNSERRRANRRKPKWKPQRDQPAQFHGHAESGYHMRREKVPGASVDYKNE